MKKLMMIVLLAISGLVCAGDVEITQVIAEAQGNGKFRFHVTLKHDDTGWDHFANKWEVLDTQGNVLGERVLLHPHVNEQPFTRSLSGVVVPEGVKKVLIKAHDSVHGASSQTFEVEFKE